MFHSKLVLQSLSNGNISLNVSGDKDGLAPETSRLTPISRRSVTSLGYAGDGRKSMPIIPEGGEDAGNYKVGSHLIYLLNHIIS